MLQELVDRLLEVGGRQALPTILHSDREPAHVYYLVDPAGKATRMEAEPPPRAHAALDLTAIVSMVQSVTVDEMPAEEIPEIWYSRAGVVGFLHGGERRDKVTLKLSESPQLKALRDADMKGFKQKDLLSFLRIKVAPAAPSSLISAVRQVKFRQLSESQSQLSQSKASIGKSLEAELTCPAALPEFVEFMLPAFDGYDARCLYTVHAALELDVQAESFSLHVLPGEFERVLREAETRLCDQIVVLLGDCTVPVLYGNP